MNTAINDEQLNKMVDRFLGWKLPNSFNPDAGISFNPEFNVEYMARQGKPPMRHEPTGTNLFDADQAREMILHILGETPVIIKRYLVCSTGEEVVIPEPEDSLEAAIKLRDEKQADDENETWEILAEINA